MTLKVWGKLHFSVL